MRMRRCVSVDVHGAGRRGLGHANARRAARASQGDDLGAVGDLFVQIEVEPDPCEQPGTARIFMWHWRCPSPTPRSVRRSTC